MIKSLGSTRRAFLKSFRKPWFDSDCKKAKTMLIRAAVDRVRDHANVGKRLVYVEVKKNYRETITRKRVYTARILKTALQTLGSCKIFGKPLKNFK